MSSLVTMLVTSASSARMWSRPMPVFTSSRAPSTLRDSNRLTVVRSSDILRRARSSISRTLPWLSASSAKNARMRDSCGLQLGLCLFERLPVLRLAGQRVAALARLGGLQQQLQAPHLDAPVVDLFATADAGSGALVADLVDGQECHRHRHHQRRGPADAHEFVKDSVTCMAMSALVHWFGAAAGASPLGTNMIRVGIVDDHAIVRSGLKQFISEQVDLRVTGEAADGAGALQLARGASSMSC